MTDPRQSFNFTFAGNIIVQCTSPTCTRSVHTANSSWEILTRNVGHSGTENGECVSQLLDWERISEISNIRLDRPTPLTTLTLMTQTIWFSCNYFLRNDFHLTFWHTRQSFYFHPAPSCLLTSQDTQRNIRHDLSITAVGLYCNDGVMVKTRWWNIALLCL